MRIKYPYQNLSLKNIKGETWKSVPGLEMYCKISSYGRLKRLPYELQFRDGRVYQKPEKVIKPVVMELSNRFKNDKILFLHVAITIYGQLYNYSLARLVYRCFIRRFNVDDKSIVILTKNRDGLDIKFTNLKMASHSEKQKRIFVLKRREPLTPGKAGRTKAITASRTANSKLVTQYSLRGRKIKTYPSVTAAAKETGISQSHISSRARGIEFSAGGYIWRYGTKLKIDISYMMEAAKQRREWNKEAYGKKVTQYSMKGKRLARYPSISDAAKATGVANSEISKVMHGHRNSAGGFYWLKGYGSGNIAL